MLTLKRVNLLFALCVIFWIWSIPAAGSEGMGDREDCRENRKQGLLLVAFGSTEAPAQVSLKKIQERMTAAHPRIDIRWAYTSHTVREKSAGQGQSMDSPTLALARMLDEHFTHVVVQSLHIVAGAEYHDLLRIVNGFNAMGGFTKLALGEPLMASQQDVTAIQAAIETMIPKERRKDEAVVFMGHGTRDPANAFYAALMFQLQLKDPNLFVGTMEVFPDVAVIKEQLRTRHIKKAYLLPFMLVAGKHAGNDMAGDGSDSWKSIFTRAGIQCVPVMKGLVAYDAFADIWVAHSERALEALLK